MTSAFISTLEQRWRRLCRRSRMERQLPELIRIILTATSAGQSLKSALREVSLHAPSPTREIIAAMLQQHTAGVPLNELLEGIGHDYPSEVMELLTSSLLFAHESGSRLRETLVRVEKIALAKQALREKLRAVTAQGRMQGVVMALLPPLLLAALHRLDPVYVEPLFATALGRMILIFTGVMNLVGLLWMQRITRPSI